MQIEVSPQLRRDLIAIAEWIEKDDPQTAERVIEELIAACEQLVSRARLYPLVPGYRGLRKRLRSPYLIFYRAHRDHILIVSVRHGRRGRL